MKKYRTIPALLTLIAPSCTWLENNDEYPVPSDRLPEFTVCLDNGEEFDSRSLQGTAMLVFFHTECMDCRKELKELQTFHREHPEANLLAISRAQGKEKTDGYWQAEGLTIPKSSQNDASVYLLFADTGIPLLIVAQDGIIREMKNAHTENRTLTAGEIEKLYLNNSK